MPDGVVSVGTANWMIFDIDRTGNRHMCKTLRCSPLTWGLAAALYAHAPASAETLIDAVNAAYATNPTLVEQRYRQKGTNET